MTIRCSRAGIAHHNHHGMNDAKWWTATTLRSHKARHSGPDPESRKYNKHLKLFVMTERSDPGFPWLVVGQNGESGSKRNVKKMMERPGPASNPVCPETQHGRHEAGYSGSHDLKLDSVLG